MFAKSIRRLWKPIRQRVFRRYNKVSFCYSDIVTEYCNWETFTAVCKPGEVVLMTAAKYGRMRFGRCLPKAFDDSGNPFDIGCSEDIINFADTECSGKIDCEYKVRDLVDIAQPCPLELSSYHEASFTCVAVEQLTSHQCSYEQYITVNPPSGYIWSDAPDATCPWRVEVEPGQRVNLTLYDFVHPDKDDHRARAVCKKYAQVREGHKESTRHGDGTSICGGAGEGRIRRVYMSDSHQVDIHLSAFRPDDENKPRFLIKYEAVDCPTMKLPVGAVAKRTGDTLAVTCSNNKRWSLKCEGTAWEGTMGTCDADPTPGPSVLNVLSTNWSSPYGLLLIIGAALIIGILIGVCCLGVCVCVRRRKRREREAVAYREHERYNAHPACRRPFKNGPQQPNALAAMHPLTEPIPPMSEQEEDYDKPYYANGTVPSWMGYRPLPVPTYEDIMFTQDRASRSPMPPGQDPRFSATEETWFNIPHHREFDPQFNTTGRMGRSKRGLKVGLDGHSRPAPAPPQYFEYDPANREYEKPQPYRRDEQDTPTRKYTKKRKQSSGDVDPDGEETQKKGNNTM